jgi:NhaP-type Na+/H+ or K+/H+ antiporter
LRWAPNAGQRIAFNDATGAIITFGVLAVAMGAGQFAQTASVLDLLKRSVVGIRPGAVLGHLAALLIAQKLKDYIAITALRRFIFFCSALRSIST